MPGMVDGLHTTEGRVVDQTEALAWFIRNSYEPPEAIAEFAAKKKI